MSVAIVCLSCARGDHQHCPGRSGLRPGLIGGTYCPCEGDCTPGSYLHGVDLFGIDPNFTGGQDANAYLDESRGEA